MQRETEFIRFQDLITKFYYKQNNLCFQIILNLGSDKTVAYKEFTDYATYKIAFEQLMKMKGTMQGVSRAILNSSVGQAISA